MSTTGTGREVEPRWMSYLGALGILLPGLVLWCLSSVFFAPKLQEVWKAGGGSESEAQWAMDLVMFLVRRGGLILSLVTVALALCELKVKWWARHRRFALSVIVAILNTAIVSGLWFMCLAALLVVPGRIRAG